MLHKRKSSAQFLQFTESKKTLLCFRM